MKKILLAIAILLFAPAAWPAETETITANEATELFNALVAVGGTHPVTIGQGASQHAVEQAYDLGPETRWALVDDLTAVRAVVVAAQRLFQQARADAESKNGGPLKPLKEAVLDAGGNVVASAVLSAEQKELDKYLKELSEAKRPIAKLFHIKRGDLKLNVNAIPTNILSALAPILDP
jgi:hypothetical protein